MFSFSDIKNKLFSSVFDSSKNDENENARKPIKRVVPDENMGLSKAMVEERTAAGWANEAVDSEQMTTKEIIISNTCTYFNLIFLVLAVLLFVVGSFRNLTFLPVIIANTLIGIIQEIKAKKVLDKMNMLNAPHSKVIRDGKEEVVDSTSLVVDDVVVFSSGNQICADAIVLSGNVTVNESLLTGESDDITKNAGDTLMSGSFIVSGSCKARLDKVGKDSYIAKLTNEAKAMSGNEQSEMIRSLNNLLKWVGILIIPMGIMLIVQSYYVNEEPFKVAVTSMVAAVIGMIPEGLYLLTSVALAVSTMRLAQKQVLLHDMKSIETLARVNVLCVDKTGTITGNDMSVDDYVPVEGYSKEDFGKLLGDFAAAMSSDNITMAALKENFTEGFGRQAVSITSFSSALKFSSVTYSDIVLVLGAPEFVLRNDFGIYEAQIKEFQKAGARVLVLARYQGVIDGKPLTAKADPIGFIILNNPIRENAPETFTYFAKQGVDIKVISGDNPVTVSNVAIKAGIKNAENYVDATTLLDKKDIYDACDKYTVFGRVTPEQKRMLVNSLKEKGHTVAMTGDGVNDVLALKDADCSIAMASGSEAASQAAQVVLLESDFSRMPSVVLEGRRVVNNIERSASLFLVKNIFSIVMAIVSIIAVMTYPLEPSQISLFTTYTIAVPGFFLALEPNKRRIEGRFMKKVLLKALPAGLTDVICVSALVYFGFTFGLSNEEVSTAATLLLAIVGFMILIKISSPHSTLTKVVIAGSMLGLIGCAVFLSDLFYMSHMSYQCVMLAVVFAIATESLFRYMSLGFEKAEARIEAFKDKKQVKRKKK